MQTLDVISVNLWQILISLINLFLLFLILKKFLFKPVKKVLDQRQRCRTESKRKPQKLGRKTVPSKRTSGRDFAKCYGSCKIPQ